jgi:2-methylcitrate dehydratase PrpD
MTNSAGLHKSLAGHLAEYATQFNIDSVPASVVEHAVTLFLDLLGAALSGVDTPEAIAAAKAATLLSPGGGPCTLWGTDSTATLQGAALHNGIIAHARELDDFGGVDHTGAVVVPVILAVAEAFPTVSGRQALEAMIVGYEVGRRVLDSAGGYRPHNHSDGFHSTGTCGSFAATAAAAKVMGLDLEQTIWALGLAGSFTGGTWAFTGDGAMSKRFNVGRASETGVVTACLARSGFTGPGQIFEAEWGGFFKTYARTAAHPDALICKRPLGYGIMCSGIKPYAACRDIHSSLDVIFDAKERYQLTAADIASIEVQCIPEMIQMIGKDDFPPSRIAAQLHLPYSIAVALLRGKAFIAEYESPILHAPEVKRLAALVQLIESPELPFDSEPYLTIRTIDGRVIQGHVDYASGASQNPLSLQKIIEKFESLAERTLPADRIGTVRDKVLSLTTITDVREIAACLRL